MIFWRDAMAEERARPGDLSGVERAPVLGGLCAAPKPHSESFARPRNFAAHDARASLGRARRFGWSFGALEQLHARESWRLAVHS